jgi:hypothetical protein
MIIEPNSNPLPKVRVYPGLNYFCDTCKCPVVFVDTTGFYFAGKWQFMENYLTTINIRR